MSSIRFFTTQHLQQTLSVPGVAIDRLRRSEVTYAVRYYQLTIDCLSGPVKIDSAGHNISPSLGMCSLLHFFCTSISCLLRNLVLKKLDFKAELSLPNFCGCVAVKTLETSKNKKCDHRTCTDF